MYVYMPILSLFTLFLNYNIYNMYKVNIYTLHIFSNQYIYTENSTLFRAFLAWCSIKTHDKQEK